MQHSQDRVVDEQPKHTYRWTAASIFANGNLVSFRVSNTDAERLKDEFAMYFAGAAIQDLPDFYAYVRRLTCDKKGCRPAEPEKVATYGGFWFQDLALKSPRIDRRGLGDAVASPTSQPNAKRALPSVSCPNCRSKCILLRGGNHAALCSLFMKRD